MKKTLLSLLTGIAVLLSNCAKEKLTQPEKDGTRYPVTFNVRTFTSEATPMGRLNDRSKLASKGLQTQASFEANGDSSAEDPWNSVSNIHLFIYNSEGNFVTQVYKNRDETSGGLFVESLGKGSYTVVAVGSSGVGGTGFTKLSTAEIWMGEHESFFGGTFLAKENFEVGSVGSNEVDLVLQRKVALLVVDITDTPPVDVISVRATVRSVGYSYKFGEFMATSGDYNASFEHNYGIEPHEFSGYFFVPNNSKSYVTSVLLEVTKARSGVVESKVIENVTVGANIKTTIRGNLFESSPQGFVVELDSEWEGETTVDF